MKKILLLGGAAQQVIAIETAKRMGLFTVLCDYLEDNPGQYVADKYYPVSTTDKDSVLEIARKENVDYVTSYASDPAMPTAAYVAEILKLPSNPYSTVNILCNKTLFRGFLREHGFNTPSANGYDDREIAIADMCECRLPVIVKPADASGSKGVTVVTEQSEIETAVDFAFSYSRTHSIIVEEYIQKKHSYLIGGDIFVIDGEVVMWGLMNCHRDDEVNALVPVGKSYPVLLEKAELQAVKATLQDLVRKIGFHSGPMNVELIIGSDNKVYPIDIGPRSGGNMIPDLLGMIFGCDVVEMCLRVAMGESFEYKPTFEKKYMATLNIHSDREGYFDSMEFSPKIEPFIIRKSIYIKKGDKVNPFRNAANALGIIFFEFTDMKTMIEMEDHMNKYVRVKLS